MEITATDGKKYQTTFYNLDTVIAVLKQDKDYISDFDREIKRLGGKKKNESG